MNRCYKRILSALLVATIILASVPNIVRAADVDYDMDYSSGGGGGTTGSGTGYSVNELGDAKACGYRFTVVASTGGMVSGTHVHDIFAKSYGTAPISAYKLFKKNSTQKYSKTQWNAYPSNYGRFSTSKNNASMDDNVNITLNTNPNGFKKWITDGTYGNARTTRILNKLGASWDKGNADKFLKNRGYTLLVEPLFYVKVKISGSMRWAAMTVTDIGMYGSYMFGENQGSITSPTESTWGYIAEYTNKVWPFSLRTSDATSFSNDKYNWGGTNSTQKLLTFKQMVEKGYGVGIAAGTPPDPDDTPQNRYISLNNVAAGYYTQSGSNWYFTMYKNARAVKRNTDNEDAAYNYTDGHIFQKSDNTYLAAVVTNNGKNSIPLANIKIQLLAYYDTGTTGDTDASGKRINKKTLYSSK